MDAYKRQNIKKKANKDTDNSDFFFLIEVYTRKDDDWLFLNMLLTFELLASFRLR